MLENNIIKVQKYLKEKGIDGFISFISDDHGSEYIAERFKDLDYLCNFSGSNGILLIRQNDSLCWTDGRYFLQAAEQLKKTDTKLMKMGIDEDVTIFIANNLKSVAFDFRVARTSFALEILSKNNKIKLINEENLIDSIWENRPSLSKKMVNILPSKVYLKSASDKCHLTLKETLSEKCAVLVSALDDIAYLTNARGEDIDFNPVFQSFLFLIKNGDVEQYNLYIDEDKLDDNVKAYFKSQSINIKKYDDIYDDVANYDEVICYNSAKTNYKLYTLMKYGNNTMLYPTKAKAIKTSIDIKETKKAHVKDGIAMCKFIYYVKNNVGKIELSELSLMEKLKDLRFEQGAYDLSFETIMGYNAHGAIIHYEATEETDVPVYNDGLLLCDSGGQYHYGTTDITRTIALANVSEKMKYHFTLVLKAHIALASAKFKYGMSDIKLDKIARKPIFEAGLDYNHGTGHGVGHILNVHEGPQNISIHKKKPTIMEKGMITSDEPGLYFENEYGIRHENEILCVKVDDTHLGFEPITYVPFDLDAIDKNMLTKKEIKWLNDYHELVYKKIARYLNKDEKEFLAKQTRKI